MDFSLLTYYLMLPLLEFFRELLGNYGWSIILVTIVIKLALLPLSLKQVHSSQKMQSQMAKLKPELAKIQEKYNLRKKKYESNPEKLEEIQREFQEQMTNLYKENGALNPLGGCLPTLLQFPILIALYWTFSGPPFQPSILFTSVKATTQVSTKSAKAIKYVKSADANFIDTKGQISRIKLETNIPEQLVVGETYNLKVNKVLGKGKIEAGQWRLLTKDQNAHAASLKDEKDWAKNIIEFNQSAENPNTATIKALKETDKFSIQYFIEEKRGHERFLFIEDLGRLGILNTQTKKPNWDICILIILMGASFWFSNKSMMGSSPQMPSLDDSQKEVQKQMQNLMPIMFLGMMAFLPIPAGVFLYFIASNIIQLLQTFLVQKLIPIQPTDTPQVNSTVN
jgi:YidC/Oxa1 family membrane protein insertase